MSEQSERRKILDMLATGQLNADEAEKLLRAVGSEDEMTEGASMHGAAVRAMSGSRREKTSAVARSLRITIDAGNGEEGDRGRVSVTVPMALAKFAGKLIPEDVRHRLEDEGIELAALLEALDDELPEGRLVDIDTVSGGEEGRRARIIVDVA